MLHEVAEKIINCPQVDVDHPLPESMKTVLDTFFQYLDRRVDHALTTPAPQTVDSDRQKRIKDMQHAASCVLDHERTVLFAQGVYRAINELHKRFPAERLEICYAGTGPFATQVTSIITQLDPAKVRFTLIDENEASLGILKRLTEKLDLDSHFDVYDRGRFIWADARTYTPQRKFHLILTETMHSALTSEPQAEITANLAQHLVEGGIFLPNEVLLSLEGRSHETDTYAHIGTVAQLDKNFTREGLVVDTTFPLPPEVTQLRLATRVQIFNEIVLHPDRSWITRSINFPRQEGAQNIRVQHELGAERDKLRMNQF